ncbi:hypothetical protein NPX13_g8874 [Xylaria arbuscula]|uniref:Cytochrome P450 n=1 Tax=Xylaria arbuscula TaxID=114810 RepID=A0A9W8N7R9_9PEZI|nr:hypothetical protein NPX13_g8874 [Xylaria arbuscula]
MAQLISDGLLFASGVLLHHVVFRRGEWDLATVNLLGSFVLCFFGSALFLSVNVHPTLPHVEGYRSALRATWAIFAPTLTGLYTSIVVYRGFFHRLRKFPGPFLARFSGLYMTCRNLFTGMRTFKDVQKLHLEYGDVVRLGPQELSIIRPSAVQALHAASAPVDKGPFYDMTAPFLSLQTIRSKTDHAPIRKVWDRGFSAKSLRDYEPRVAKYTEQLLQQLESRVSKPLNMTQWIGFYGFDVMGDLAFGQSFDMLKSGTVNYYIGLMQDHLKVRFAFGRIPWAFRILQALASLNASASRFHAWIEDQVKTRMKNEPDTLDVFSWILEDYNARPVKTQQDFFNLMGEGILITIAGRQVISSISLFYIDTTSSTMTCLFFELTRNPEIYKKLQDEIDECFVAHGDKAPGHYELSKLEYLQACIDETLRMYPPLPGGVQRMTPPEGLQLDHDLFIPGNTIVQTPLYTMYRGTFSCVGKQLALMEMRYVVSRMVRLYDMNFAKGQTPEAFTEGNFDTFTVRLAPLNMVLTHRLDGKKGGRS